MKVTVTTGPAVAPGFPGAVITVDQAPGLPEAGTVTVSTTVAVLPGPSGIVTVRTELAEFTGGAGTVTVTPDVGTSGTRGIVTVAPEPGTPGVSGTVTVTRDTAEFPFPGEAVTVAPGAGEAPEPRGTVTVTTGTVMVLLGGNGSSVDVIDGSSVSVTVTTGATPEEPWPIERSVSDEVHVEDSRPEAASAEPEDRPGSAGARVTVTTVAGPTGAVGVV